MSGNATRRGIEEEKVRTRKRKSDRAGQGERYDVFTDFKQKQKLR